MHSTLRPRKSSPSLIPLTIQATQEPRELQGTRMSHLGSHDSWKQAGEPRSPLTNISNNCLFCLIQQCSGSFPMKRQHYYEVRCSNHLTTACRKPSTMESSHKYLILRNASFIYHTEPLLLCSDMSAFNFTLSNGKTATCKLKKIYISLPKKTEIQTGSYHKLFPFLTS